MSALHLLFPKVKDLLPECAVHTNIAEIKEPWKRSIYLRGVSLRVNQYHLFAIKMKEGKVYSCR